MMRIDTAVVPVAGRGTRLLPITRLVAKEFLPLGRLPVIVRVVRELRDAGITRIIFVVSPPKLSLAESLAHWQSAGAATDDLMTPEDSCFPGMKFQFVVQEQQLGLGHAIWCARNEVDPGFFVVALGDCVIGSPYQIGSDLIGRMISTLQDRKADVVVGFEEVPFDAVSRFGIAKLRTEGDIFEIGDLVEKPSPDQAPSNLAICGRYLFQSDIFGELDKQQRGFGNEIQLTDAIAQLIRKGCQAYGVRVAENETRFDVGDLGSYAQAFVEFAMADPELRAGVEQALSSRRADLER